MARDAAKDCVGTRLEVNLALIGGRNLQLKTSKLRLRKN